MARMLVPIEATVLTTIVVSVSDSAEDPAKEAIKNAEAHIISHYSGERRMLLSGQYKTGSTTVVGPVTSDSVAA